MDPVALTKLFGADAAAETPPEAVSAADAMRTDADVSPNPPIRRRTTAHATDDRAPKHRAKPAGNRRAAVELAQEDAFESADREQPAMPPTPPVQVAPATPDLGRASAAEPAGPDPAEPKHEPAFDDILFAGSTADASGRAPAQAQRAAVSPPGPADAAPVTTSSPIEAAPTDSLFADLGVAEPQASTEPDSAPRASVHAPPDVPAPPSAARFESTHVASGRRDGSASGRTRSAVQGSRRSPRRLAVLSSAAAVLVLAGLGAVAVANDVPASLFDASASSAPADAGDAVAGSSAPTITSPLSESAAPFTGGTPVTVAGEHLDQVAQVSVAGVSAEIVEASAGQLTFTVPATSDTSVGPAEVVFADREGRPVEVAVGAGGATAAAEASTDAQPAPGASAEASAPVTDAATGSLTLTYTTDPAIDAQLAYVLAHWSDYNTADYPAVRGKDAVNFASQSLVARGWTMDDAWNVDDATGAMSAAWSSSTALRDYLLSRTDHATELADAQRDQVKVGDLAQFDWDDSGDRDHTAVVTRVEHTDAGTRVWVASHTKDADYWDVDAALASGGGTVSWFSIR